MKTVNKNIMLDKILHEYLGRQIISIYFNKYKQKVSYILIVDNLELLNNFLNNCKFNEHDNFESLIGAKHDEGLDFEKMGLRVIDKY